MIAWGLMLALASPSRAQVAPALTEAPAPVEAVQPSNVDEFFSRFTSGRPMIPTLKEVQAQQLKRDLAPLKGDGGSADLPGGSILGHFNQPPQQGVRRDSTERVDVAVSRPVRRIEVGAGYSEEDINIGNRHVSGNTSQYGFLRFDLSKAPLARKLLHSPTAVHAETEIQDDRVHVSQDDYTTDFLKHPH
jgi:hypothetical protein